MFPCKCKMALLTFPFCIYFMFFLHPLLVPISVNVMSKGFSPFQINHFATIYFI